MASKDTTATGFVNVSREITEGIRKVLDKQAIKFVRAIKQDTRSGKTEDRILVRDANTLTPNTPHPSSLRPEDALLRRDSSCVVDCERKPCKA
ncbi:Capping protein Arp2/3 and myosin-I linker protein 3, partial [Dissostichus eleginoides]